VLAFGLVAHGVRRTRFRAWQRHITSRRRKERPALRRAGWFWQQVKVENIERNEDDGAEVGGEQRADGDLSASG